jgi:hypothetical protein
MTKPEDRDALRRVADRSFAGKPMSTADVIADGIDADVLTRLELEGFVEIGDRDGVPTATLTDRGLGALTPRST